MTKLRTKGKLDWLKEFSSIAAALFGALLGLSGSLFSLISITVDTLGGKEKVELLIFIIVGTGVITIIISFFVFLLRERTAQVTRLKREVTHAFLKTLKQSSFNPHRLEEKNEQPSPQAAK